MNKYTVGELIYKKRKEKGLTQSQLGEMLGVSNKAVSKWENGESYPEFSAIQPLCEILSISADELVKGQENFEQQTFDDNVKQVQQDKQSKVQMSEEGKKFEKKFYIAIALGVFLCVFSVAGLFLSRLLGASEGGSVSVLLACVAAGVFLFISFGIKHEHFQKGFEQEFIDKCQKYAYLLATGVSMAILSPCFFLLFYKESAGNNGDLLTLSLFFVWIAIAVLFIVFAGLCIGKTKKQWGIDDSAENETVQDKLSGMVMTGALAIFLLCGFVWGLWHPAWVVFPVGGIICGIIGMTKKGD